MKRLWMMTLLCVLLWGVAACRSTGFVRPGFIITDETQIGIMVFDTPAVVDKNCGIEIADTFGATLLKNGFNIIDRSQIEKVLEEQQFQATGLVTDRNAVKIGNLAGVRYILTGVATQYNFEQRVVLSAGNLTGMLNVVESRSRCN